MTYRIEGLAPAAFESLFCMMDGDLAERGATRVTADLPSGYPCRISLEDAAEGEELILLNYVSHDVAGPFRTAYGIMSARARRRSPIGTKRRPISIRARSACAASMPRAC